MISIVVGAFDTVSKGLGKKKIDETRTQRKNQDHPHHYTFKIY